MNQSKKMSGGERAGLNLEKKIGTWESVGLSGMLPPPTKKPSPLLNYRERGARVEKGIFVNYYT
ncbi:MAG: hypothetical protein ACHQ6U_08790 [Thermodesulfobacteriota bacterium]